MPRALIDPRSEPRRSTFSLPTNIGTTFHQLFQPGTPGSTANMFFPYWTLLVPLLHVSAQSCANYGTQSGNTCLCPPGFVNASSDCSVPVCGGSLGDAGLQGIQIPRTDRGFGNISAGVCACSEGWSGPGCTGECSLSAARSEGSAVLSRACESKMKLVVGST
jgi:hypothetical protein